MLSKQINELARKSIIKRIKDGTIETQMKNSNSGKFSKMSEQISEISNRLNLFSIKYEPYLDDIDQNIA